MKRSAYILACMALLASCTPKVKETTRIYGTMPSGLDEVEISYAKVDTVIKSEDGKFFIEVPTDDASLVSLQAGPAEVQLIPDGTILDVVMADSSTVSSRKPQISVQERLNAFMNKAAGFEDAQAYKKYLLETINFERDNVIGAVAFQTVMMFLDDDEIGQALRTLTPRVRRNGNVALVERLYNSRKETSEGCPFRDFTVRTVAYYDYGVPVYSRVRLSDYAGQGAFTLLFFWNSRDELSLAQIPQIKRVAKDFGKKGLNVVSVAIYDNAYDAMETAAEQGMDWIALNSADDSVADLYGAMSLPMVMYIAPDGTILNRDLYGEDIYAAAKHYFSQAAE